MAGYVFTPIYIGADRRTAVRARFFERRKIDADQLAPSLETALRQLTTRAIELESPRTASAYIDRLKATRALAQKRSQFEVAVRLEALIEALTCETAPGTKSELAENYLRQASCELAPR